MASTNQSTQDPEGKLAVLIKVGLGVEVEPERLRDFVAAHWNVVSSLTHAIHDQDVAARNAAIRARETQQSEALRIYNGTGHGEVGTHDA